MGGLFVVAVVMVDSDSREGLERLVLKVERRTQRGAKKWHRTDIDHRRGFAAEFPSMAIAARFAWAEWTGGTDYLPRTAEAIVNSANACCPGAQLTVIVDGLKEAEKAVITTTLRRSGVRFRGVKVGCRDESYPLLRLADALAGFLRDVREGDPYAVDLWPAVRDLFVQV